MKSLHLFGCMFFFSILYSQRNYFVSRGAVEGDGTIQRPFTSLQKLSALTLRPGDTVFFHAGDTILGNILLNQIHGSEQRNIIFTSYGKGRSTIDGGNKTAFDLENSDDFRVVNISFVGSGRKNGNTADGMRLRNCKKATVRNLEVSGFQKAGLMMFNSEDAEVDKVYAHENGFAGILIEGDYKKKLSGNIHIKNCRADNNPGDPTNLTNHSGNGILVGNCRNVLIEYCTATNNGWDMPRMGNGPVGIWAYEADSVVIQHCIAYRNKTTKGAADGGGFDLDGGVTNSIIQYCLSYENWGSGYGIFEYDGADRWNNNTVRYCVSINDGLVTDHACALLIWNGSNADSNFTNFYAYNNFFYNDNKYAFGFLDQSRHNNFSFFNNVFIACDSCEILNGSDSSLNDLFLGNVWMKQNGGFGQDGFDNFRKWSDETGREQRNGKTYGTSFKQKIFAGASKLNVTDPYALKKNSLLLSLCNSVLRNKGIDIRKIFSIDVGITDFFGHVISAKGRSTPGICGDK